VYRAAYAGTDDWGRPLNAADPLTAPEYTDGGLTELTEYYYAVSAVDQEPNESELTVPVKATTLLGPHGPEVDGAPNELTFLEDEKDNFIDLNSWFSDINGDELEFRIEGAVDVTVDVDNPNGSMTLSPRKDWSGRETHTVYASDGTEETSHQVTVIVTPVNDPPGEARILSPEDGAHFSQARSLDLTASCSDPDLDYGDVLTFTWSTPGRGELGVGATLRGITLPVGKHVLTLRVSDKAGTSTSASVTVIILPQADEDSDGDGLPDDWEKAHGLNPYNPTDAETDPDGDGKTFMDVYLEEYLSGDAGGGGGESDKQGGSSGTDTQAILLVMSLVVAVVVIVVVFLVVNARKKRQLEEEEMARARQEGWRVAAQERAARHQAMAASDGYREWTPGSGPPPGVPGQIAPAGPRSDYAIPVTDTVDYIPPGAAPAARLPAAPRAGAAPGGWGAGGAPPAPAGAFDDRYVTDEEAAAAFMVSEPVGGKGEGSEDEKDGYWTPDMAEKRVAREAESAVEMLEKINQLRKSGAISEEEYQTTKRRLLKKL
jgi:hypothetical protein